MPATTLDGLESPRQDLLGLWGRRAFLTLVALVIVAAFAGFAGTRTSTATGSTDNGWALQLRYASIARAGLDVPFTATVTHRGGFGKKVTLALTGTYLDIYETQGYNPNPSSSTRDGKTLYLTFDAPKSGDTFRITYDAYIQPAAQVGRSATVSLIIDGKRLSTLHIHTWLWP